MLSQRVKKKLWVPLASFACICVLLLLAHSRESRMAITYNGSRLDVWLKHSISGDTEASMVIRQIGTNGVPTLLQLIASTPNRREMLWFTIGQKTGIPAAWQGHSSLERNLWGEHGFKLLGSNAAFAIPQLITLARDGRTSASATREFRH